MWTNVNDRLPERGAEYAWYSDYVMVAASLDCGIGLYDFDRGCWTYSLCGKVQCDDNNVTHWMPLPAPPTTDNVVGANLQHTTAPTKTDASA